MSKEKTTEITNRLESLTWEEGLRELGLFNLEKKRLRGSLTKVYEYLMETTKKMEPDSSQQCPIKVQQARGTN